MNDKLCLSYPGNTFEQTSNFDNFYTCKKLETVAPTGEVTEKLSWHHNADSFQADIGAHGLYLKFNANKVSGHLPGSELLPYSQFKTSIDEIETKLSETGIKCKLIQGKISRADDAFDVKTELPYKSYYPLICTLAPVRIKQAQQRIYENTMYYGNKSRQISIYDKTKEQNLKDNVIRIEYRHLKRVGMNLNDITENKYYQYRILDKQLIEKNIFSLSPGILESEYITFFIEQLEQPITKTNVIQNTFYYVLSSEQTKTGINVLPMLTSTKQDKNYWRNRRFIADLSNKKFMDSSMVDRYTELKTLFKQVL